MDLCSWFVSVAAPGPLGTGFPRYDGGEDIVSLPVGWTRLVEGGALLFPMDTGSESGKTGVVGRARLAMKGMVVGWTFQIPRLRSG